MTKTNLEMGMLVVYRNGKHRVVTASKSESKNGYQFIGNDGNQVGQYSRYDTDMKHVGDSNVSPQNALDIVKVYDLPKVRGTVDKKNMYTFDLTNRACIYDRATEEAKAKATMSPVKLTVAQLMADGNKQAIATLIEALLEALN